MLSSDALISPSPLVVRYCRNPDRRREGQATGVQGHRQQNASPFIHCIANIPYASTERLSGNRTLSMSFVLSPNAFKILNSPDGSPQIGPLCILTRNQTEVRIKTSAIVTSNLTNAELANPALHTKMFNHQTANLPSSS